jgi:Ca-activated chloride channel family protein
MVPLNISEETAQNISRANFLDTPTFVYKSTSIPTKEDLIQKGDNIILDFRYPREVILRVLAKNQFADGSFVDANKDRLYNKVETTAMALLAFTLGKDDISIYVNQLNKSIKFLLKSLEENVSWFDERLIILTALALKSSLDKGILTGSLEEQSASKVIGLKAKLSKNDKAINVLNLNGRASLKEIAPLIFITVNNNIQEKIAIADEKDSIYSMSKLGVLKSI